MKKLISILLSVIMLVSTGAFGITAYAKGESPSTAYSYTLGTTVEAYFDENTIEQYYKFKADKSGYYTFEVLDADDDTGEFSITTLQGNYVEYTYVDEYTGRCYCVAELKKGEFYYIELEAFPYGDCHYTITSYPHTHIFRETDFDEAGYRSSGTIEMECTDCDAYKYVKISGYKGKKLSTKNYVYDGKVKTPTLTAYSMDNKAINKDYYKVKYPKGRKNVGRYKITFKFKKYYDNDSDYQYEYFYILPKSTSIKRVSAAKKGFTVKYKKQATQTTGYQIQYATDKKFKKNVKTVTVKKNSTTSAKVKGLKSKKKYYVRVRTYKTVSGKKYYSSWSGTKSIKTK